MFKCETWTFASSQRLNLRFSFCLASCVCCQSVEGSLLLFPPAPLRKGQRRENGEEGAQPQGVPSQDPDSPGLGAGWGPKGWWKPERWDGDEAGRETTWALAWVWRTPCMLGKNVGINRNYFPCHKMRQLCSGITPGVGVFSPGGFAVPQQPQCPQALSRGRSQGGMGWAAGSGEATCGQQVLRAPSPKHPARAHVHGSPSG